MRRQRRLAQRRDEGVARRRQRQRPAQVRVRLFALENRFRRRLIRAAMHTDTRVSQVLRNVRGTRRQYAGESVILVVPRLRS